MNLFQVLRKSQGKIVILIIASLMLIASCEKDRDIDVEELDYGNGLTIQKAQKWWSKSKPVSFRSENTDSIMTALNVTPLWDQAIQTSYMGQENLVLVPFRWNSRLVHLENRGSINLVIFYDQGLERLSATIMGVIASESRYNRPLSQFSVADFSGYIFQIDEQGDVPWIIEVENGRFIRRVSNNSGQSIIEFRDGDPKCYSFSRGALGRLLGSIFEGIGNLANQIVSTIGGCFDSSGSDSGGSNGGEVAPYVNPYWGNFEDFRGQNNQGNTGETGGGSGGNPPLPPGNFFSGYFDNDIFATARFMELLFDFMTEYNLGLSVFQLTEIVNPACMETPEIFNGCALNSILNWVNHRANLTPEERNDLRENIPKLRDAVAFLMHLEASGLNYGEMESTMDRWFETYGMWDGLTEDEQGVICCDPPIVINNGITLSNWITPASPITTSGLAKVGFSVGNYPDNFDDPNDDPDDIRSGTDGDDRGIYLDIKPAIISSSGNIITPARPYTDSELFDKMTTLFRVTTHCDNRPIALLFKEEFRTNNRTGKFFYHKPLSDKVAVHPVMKNYMKRFGEELNKELSKRNGEMISKPVDMEDLRPQFNTKCSDRPKIWYDRVHGYQILINDTQAVDIFLIPNSYTYTSRTKAWKGRFLFVVTDHFGLDKKDARNYQWYPFGEGFSAWWRLQHTRGYKPFRTRIFITTDIEGTLLN